MSGEKISSEQGDSITTPWDALTDASLSQETDKIVGEGLEAIHQIDNFLLNNYHQYGEASCADMAFVSASEILGAAIGIKPTALTTIELVEEDQNADTEAFEDMLSKLGMTMIPEDIGGIKRRYFYGKDANLVKRAQDTFHKLWQTEVGTKEREIIDEQLGFLLGYPETAVLGNPHNTKHLSKFTQNKLAKQYPDQLICHTQEHIAEEYAAYEQRIFVAIQEYCPNIYRAHERPRWQTLGKKILGLLDN